MYQEKPYDEINIFINDKYDLAKKDVPNTPNQSYVEPMESDDSRF